MIRRRPIWVVVIALAAAVEARAEAPPDQYGLYDEYDVTITDDKTGLTWQRLPGSRMNLDAAVSYCASLSLPAPGFWRLPSYKELLTLVDESPHLSYETVPPLNVAIDDHAFPGSYAPSGLYWSSSASASGNGFIYVVDFKDGTVYTVEPGGLSYVRCVSGP